VRTVLAQSWRGLLVAALGALGGVALATMIGNPALARAFGTLAWFAAGAGAISGLVAGGGIEERGAQAEPPERSGS
jgi:outer membrane lipoprotein SlyB